MACNSVADWRPILAGAWAEHEVFGSSPRRRWELTVDARDGKARRDGGKATNTGRQDSAALWDARESGNPAPFEDIDNDAVMVSYSVLIEEIEEAVGKPADAARWGDVRLALKPGELNGLF